MNNRNAASGRVRNLTGLLKTIDEAVDGMLSVTPDDPSRAQIIGSKLRLVESTFADRSPRAIARRILACAVMGEFLLLILLSGLAWPFLPAWSVFLLSCAGMLSELALTIGIFYYGYYGIQSIAGKMKSGSNHD